MKRKLRLSQCMIVKNEEENIRRALSWGKGLVFEQIVVDTGSTDRTIEIAESIGAKVYHYKWEDDFSAAKNFALSKASGDWIAFLDADEYFREEDIPKLRQAFEKIMEFPPVKQPDLLRCALLNIDENGDVFASSKQDRIFKNDPDIRYQNRIHEKVCHISAKKFVLIDYSKDISVFHTGYAQKVYKEKNKAERNISILQEVIKQEPENYDAWAYLADSFMTCGRTAEGKKAYLHVIEHPEADIVPELRQNAISSLLRMYANDREIGLAEVDRLYRQYTDSGSAHPDIEYWTGLYYINHGMERWGVQYLEKALKALENNSFSFTLYLPGDLEKVYNILSDVYKESGEKQQAVRYAVLSLKNNNRQEAVISSLLRLFLESGEAIDGIWQFLGKIYDLTSLKDRLYLYKTAKENRLYTVEEYIYQSLTAEERKWLHGEKIPQYKETAMQLMKQFPDFQIRNVTDINAGEIIKQLEERTVDDLVSYMKQGLETIRGRNEEFYTSVLSFYQDNGFWGSLLPVENNFEVFYKRAEVLKRDFNRILSFYINLKDYRSKRVLYALLKHWIYLETVPLTYVKENDPYVFDPDLFPSGEDCTMLELWADEGNDIKNFVQTYGDTCRKIYCYTQSADAALRLRSNLRGYDMVHILNAEQTMPDIDNEIAEPVHFICLHGNGEELALLDRCAEIITSYHPHLIISAFYDNDMLWKLEEKIRQIDSSYQFYLRYYGEDLIATDYFLIAV